VSIQAGGERLQIQGGHHARRELDREGQAVESAADPAQEGGVVCGEGEAGANPAGAVGEQEHRHRRTVVRVNLGLRRRYRERT
jgi:hypothetical protein